MPEIYQVIVSALLTAFIVLVLNKTQMRWKLRDYLDSKHIKLIADMLDCDFCLCFWTGMLIAIGFIAFKFPVPWFLPFCSAPLARIFL